jgi:hypothetical protein
MATTWTRRQMIDRVLDKLGVLVPGQTVSDEMVDKVDQVLDPCLEMLRVLDVIDVTAPSIIGTPDPPTNGAFPAELCLPLADCIAWAAAAGFNLAGDPSLKVLNDIGEDTLVRLSRPGRTRRDLRVDKATRSTSRIGRGSFSQGT